MKLKVAINGEIDVSPEVAAQLRSGNRKINESTLGYRLNSYVAEYPLFNGRESSIRASVIVEDEEMVTA